MEKIKWYIHTKNEKPIDGRGRHNFTLTTNPNEQGWETDSGICGYGLPKELAQWICDKLNAQEENAPMVLLEEWDGDGWTSARWVKNE